MKSPFKIISALLLAVIAMACLICIIGSVRNSQSSSSIEERAAAAQRYACRNGLSENYCVFVDYSLPSGSPRLFVWSFSEGKVIYRGYAMHGPGMGSTDSAPVFSNKPGSNCSSLGRFEITKRHGKRNKSGYHLKGRDISNSNAQTRGIMLHSSAWVDMNRARKYIPLHPKSCMGCVTVSCKDMRYLGKLIEGEQKHILLWSYCTGQEAQRLAFYRAAGATCWLRKARLPE